jgi:hypothetical protein
MTPVQANAGGWANVFTTRLYDLRNFAALQSKIASIESEAPFASPPTVTRIEVAFDGRLKDPAAPNNRDQLTALAARMVYRLAAPVSENRRTYRDGRGSPSAIPRTLQAVERRMGEGHNVGIGDKTGDRWQHGYVKTTDYNKKPIPVAEHRARFEIALGGAYLPHSDVGSYRNFRFETLARYISFRKEDETADPMQQVIVAGYADRASHRKNIKRRGDGGIRKNIMPADQELTGTVSEEMRSLSRRWTPDKRAQ